VNASNEKVLGVVLDDREGPAEVVVGGDRLTVIGYLEEPTTDLVAVDRAGVVWCCSADGSDRTLMNSSVPSLNGFLDLFAAFFDADPAADSGPVTYSAEQMAERLAAFRRGEIKPAAPRRDDRKSRVKQLKKALKDLDKRAVKGPWWSIILEQVDDGIL
jgi:hypothetical protein